MDDVMRGAENPATWGAAEQLISDEVTLHFASLNRGERGLSLPRKIADRLRQAGLLLPEHNHMTREVKARGECPRCDADSWNTTGYAPGSPTGGESGNRQPAPILTQQQVDESYAWADHMMAPGGIFRQPEQKEGNGE
jgi:hypothetical protein